MEQPDIMKPPPDCPNCHGQTEWTQLPNGKYVAMCMCSVAAFSVTVQSISRRIAAIRHLR